MTTEGIQSFDAIVIGSGQGGSPLAIDLANAGRSVALIEREHIAGTCINEGCTPTKTMIASARVAHLVSRAADFGVLCGTSAVDLAIVRDRKRAIVESFRASSLRRLEAASGLEIIWGEARFTAPHRLMISLREGGTRTLTAPAIFINTGARPSSPDLPGLDSVKARDSTSIMELGRLPKHLIVLGGGYVGLEFGQMFRRFGSRVTIVQRRSRLLPREEPEISDAIAEILQQDAIALELGVQPEAVETEGNGAITLTVAAEGGRRTVTGSHLLLAAGRTPNTDSLHLDDAGVVTDERGYVTVNDRLETNVEGIYAIGDVKGGPAFTHISYDDFRVLRSNLLEGGRASIAERQVPYVLFTDPQLGRIGLTEQEAHEADLPILTATLPMNWIARALEMDESRGLIKAVVHAETGRILGASVLGVEGGELMACLQIAMIGDIPYTVLKDTVFAHPTLAESLNNLFAALRP